MRRGWSGTPLSCVKIERTSAPAAGDEGQERTSFSIVIEWFPERLPGGLPLPADPSTSKLCSAAKMLHVQANSSLRPLGRSGARLWSEFKQMLQRGSCDIWITLQPR